MDKLQKEIKEMADWISTEEVKAHTAHVWNEQYWLQTAL